jgi:hypothetical protein
MGEPAVRIAGRCAHARRNLSARALDRRESIIGTPKIRIN